MNLNELLSKWIFCYFLLLEIFLNLCLSFCRNFARITIEFSLVTLFFGSSHSEVPNRCFFISDIWWPRSVKGDHISKINALFTNSSKRKKIQKNKNWKHACRARIRTSETSKMEFFVTIVNYHKPVTIATKSSFLDDARI